MAATLAYASMTPSTMSPTQPQPHSSRFAFAQIQGDICLVHMSSNPSALMASDVHIFRHEFITIFRYSHSASVHPADLHILYTIDDRCTLYDEDQGTVFLAKDIMDRLQKLIAASGQHRHVAHTRHSRRVSMAHSARLRA